jgi:voltage-gated potassium channel
MACLALFYLGIGFLQENLVGAMSADTLAPAEYLISFIFLAEFLLRFYAAPSRRAYLRAHWIDLLALLPMIRWLRFLRLGRFFRIVELARVLRLGLLVRVLVQLDRVTREMRDIATRNRVHMFLSIAIGLVAVGGTLVWALEHTINPAFRSFTDAIWWAFATMTTVGYGNGPMTLPGRVIAAIVMVVGIGCFGVITATVTAYFVQQAPNNQQTTHDELMGVLEDLRARLARIEQDMHGDEALNTADRPALSALHDEYPESWNGQQMTRQEPPSTPESRTYSAATLASQRRRGEHAQRL